MKEVGIRNITINNPQITSYVKRIKAWDPSEKFELKNNSFYAIYLDDEFLAASTIDYDKESSNISILIVNGSIQHYDKIQNKSTQLLTDIAKKEFGEVKNVKVTSARQLVLK